MKKIGNFEGIEIYYIETRKFKTGSINITFADNLSRERAYKNALIPAILARGSKSYPSQREISKRLMDLYGAGFTTSVEKKGEIQLIQFIADFVEDEYIEEKTNVLSDLLDLIFEIITGPFSVTGAFKQDYFDQEMENLNDEINSIINDKQSYALIRCFEEMCKDEAYSISELGSVFDSLSLSNEDLYEYYRGYFLRKLPIKIFISSKQEPKLLIDKFLDHIDYFKGEKINLDLGFMKKNPDKVNEFVDMMSLSQGKLTLGFRTNIDPRGEESYALTVLNGIFGGSVQSKLFQNVREKHSLAYYAASRLERYKGLLIAYSGIEFENKEKTQALIIDQLEDIKAGLISQEEFESTRKMYRNSYNSYKDTQFGIMDFYINQIFLEKEIMDIDQMIEKIYAVTIEDVVAVAKKIKLDTVYFLNRQEDVI